MSPLGWTATPVGRCSWPGVLPRTPKRLLNWPSFEKICSAKKKKKTHKNTFCSVQKGDEKVQRQRCSRLLTRHELKLHYLKAPLGFVTWTHWLLLSAISTLPKEEAATPWRLVNSPLFLPFVPGKQKYHRPQYMLVCHGVNTCFRMSYLITYSSIFVVKALML